MKKRILLLFSMLIALSFSSINAQETELLWAEHYGTTEIDRFWATTISGNGNIYSTGRYVNASDFDPGVGLFELSGDGNIFIQKLNNTGDLIWVKNLLATDLSDSSIIYNPTEGKTITSDTDDNVIIAGAFDYPIDFDPGPAVFELEPDGVDIFIQKMDGAGNFQWAINIGAEFLDYATSITTDADNNIYVTGLFWDEVDFDPDPTNEIILNSSELLEFGIAQGTFIMKLDPDGNVLWAENLATDVKGGFPHDIDTDSDNNVVVAGHFNGETDFALGDDEEFLVLATEDAYVVKYDTDANLQWVNTLASSSVFNICYAIDIDEQDNIYCTGTFGGDVDFDNSDEEFEMSADGFNDTYVQKLTAEGDMIWAKQVSGPGFVNSYDIVVDSHGDHDIYFTGTFSQHADFDPGTGEHELTTEGAIMESGTNMYIEKLTPEGNFMWAERIGSNQNGEPRSIATTSDAGVLISGYYGGDYDFDPTDSDFILDATGINDGFMAKYLFCPSEFFSLNETDLPSVSFECETGDIEIPTAINGCDVSYLGVSDIELPISEAGEYTINWTYENSDGQLLEQEQQLSIIAIDTEVSHIGNELQAMADGYSYQWLDCDDGNNPIAGATSQIFSPEAAGNYAVEITNSNGCSQISDCANFFGVGIDENGFNSMIRIYPNPTAGTLQINLTEKQKSLNISIIDILGHEINHSYLTETQHTDIKIDAPKGWYFIEIENELGNKARTKILKY